MLFSGFEPFARRLTIYFLFSRCLLQKKALAGDLYEQVFYSLDLIEKDYFGLQYTDANNVKHWLDPTKAIKKQVKSRFLQLCKQSTPFQTTALLTFFF